MSLGTIMQYDKWGHLIWYWKSSPVYLDQVFTSNLQKGRLLDIHENAFYFDEQRQNIHISFKNISEVIDKEKAKGGKITIDPTLARIVAGTASAATKPPKNRAEAKELLVQSR